MSLRQIAKELGISPAYLSYMLNGKRPWRKDLYQRYMGVVNTFVNSPHESGYNYTGAQEGIRTPTPDKGKRILSPPRLPFRHPGFLPSGVDDLCTQRQPRLGDIF